MFKLKIVAIISTVVLVSTNAAYAGNPIYDVKEAIVSCFGDSNGPAVKLVDNINNYYEHALNCEHSYTRILQEEHFYIFAENYLSSKSSSCVDIIPKYNRMSEYIKLKLSELSSSCETENLYSHTDSGKMVCTVINVDGLNIRNIPEILDSGTWLSSVTQGYQLNFIDRLEEWVKVWATLPGGKKVIGWMSEKYLSCEYK